MPADLSFRNASLRDADAITNLINLAFSVERFFVEGDRITAPEVRQRFDTGMFILAEQDGLLIGCVYVELQGQRCYAGLLSVDPSQQRMGVGTRLMQAAEDYARANGCLAMDLQTLNLREELPPYYRKLGYVETGAAPFPVTVPTKLACHFVKMAKTLSGCEQTPSPTAPGTRSLLRSAFPELLPGELRHGTLPERAIARGREALIRQPARASSSVKPRRLLPRQPEGPETLSE